MKALKCWTLADHVHKSVVCHTLIYTWQKMAKLRLIYMFISRRYWSFTTNGFYFWAIIASIFSTYFQNVARPCSCWDPVGNTHTQTRCTCTHIRQILFYCSSSTEHTDYTAVQSCVPWYYIVEHKWLLL